MSRIGRLTIIGVGLIGGSLALALKRAGAVGEIVGCGRDRQHLQRALSLGVIDRLDTDPAHAVAEADVVFVATPVSAMADIFRAIRAALPPQAVLTDGGSVKGSVVEAARAAFGRVPPRFVPGHPIAGTEKSGVEAAFAELFDGQRVILTPLADTEAAALERVRSLWASAGAQVTVMNADHHDRVLAATSHLPHVLAYALVDRLAAMDASEEVFAYAGGGFRDFSRIASSNPAMWRDIVLANRGAVLDALDDLLQALERVRQDIERGDGEALQACFTRAKSARDRFIALAASGCGADNGMPSQHNGNP